eukprot:TRINITY_DN1625_c0_g2_i5.p1 TRINITY_DN1625_c0_g2~~TRINITY_DN1625_c0_g2_i5.p1  ORF type:complete len:235 (+),score=56.32 TRINITY_DN1625_c0_g2_i5:218-922(+)
MELSLLCGNDVLLIIRESSGSRTILYSSLGDNNKLFKDILVNHEATHSYSNLSYEDLFEKSIGEKTSSGRTTAARKGRKRGNKEEVKGSSKKEKEAADQDPAKFYDKIKEKGEGLKLDLSKSSILPPLAMINTPNIANNSSYLNADLNFFRINQTEDGQGKDQFSYFPSGISGCIPGFLNSADGILKDTFQSPQPINFRSNESFRPTDNSMFYSPMPNCATPQYGGDTSKRQDP